MTKSVEGADSVEGVVSCEIQFTERGWCFFAWDGKRIAIRVRGKWVALGGTAYTVTGDLDNIKVYDHGMSLYG